MGETVPGTMREILGLLGLSEAFLRQRHRPAYELRCYWGSAQATERHSIFNRDGHGYHLDRAGFDHWLRGCAVEAGVTLERPVQVVSVAHDSAASWSTVIRRSGERRTLEARFLVDATGGGAWVGRRLGAVRHVVHPMVGVVRWFKRTGLDPVTQVEAAPDGWWYSVPLPGDELVLAWMTDATSDSARAGHSEGLWRRSLEAAPATLKRLEDAEPIGGAVTRLTGPALTHWPLRHDFLPVGDAACSFDPLYGAGLLFALRSAIDAADVLAEAASGKVHGFAEYRDGVYQALREHLRFRHMAYNTEQRFPESPFWSTARRDLQLDLAPL